MAYRRLIQTFTDISTKCFSGQNCLFPKDTRLHCLPPSQGQNCQTQRFMCAWQRFQTSSTGRSITLWCHKVNDNFAILAILFAKQCNLVAAQRLRRGAQIMTLYSRLYDKQSVQKMVHVGKGGSTPGRPVSLLFGAVLFAWHKHEITDSSINMAVDELTSLFTGDLSPKKRLETSLGTDWEPVMDREHLSAWRKPIPDSYLYEYKVYGSFNDISARAFFDVQTDLNYRKQWDKLVIQLEVIDKEEDSGSEVVRWVTHFPFPMYSREYIFIRKYKVDYDKKVMVVVSKGTDHPKCPLEDKYVRVHQYKSDMVIRPHNNCTFDDNGFDYVLTYYDNPQAAIPSAAIKWMASTGVPDFVNKLHDAAKLLESGRSDTYGTDLDEDKLAM